MQAFGHFFGLLIDKLTFLEFLDAMGESRHRNLLENVEEPVPLVEVFHSHLIDLLRHYYLESSCLRVSNLS